METKTSNIETTYASSIENIDFAFYEWLDEEMNLFCNFKDGFKKVPVLWVTPERAFQVKQNKEFRDFNGTLNVPMITVERTSIVKDQKNSTVYYANIPAKNTRHMVSRRINQKKTSEFKNSDWNKVSNRIGFVSPRNLESQKVVYQFSNMMLPVYAQFNYNITIFTQFQQQMNELVQPFIAKTGSTRYFTIKRNNYLYECFIEPNIDTKNNVSSMEEEERRYITNISIKVTGNIVSSGENEEDSVIKTYENAVEIKIPRDRFLVAKSETTEPKQFSTSIPSNSGIQIYSNVLMKKVFLAGNDTDSVYRFYHNFNTRDILVIIRTNGGIDGNDFSKVEAAVEYSNPNYIEVDFAETVTKDAYVVVIMG